VTPPALAGTTDWITEDPSNNNRPYPMPDYGAAFFYDALAGSKTQERDIRNAVLVNIVSAGSALSAAASENQWHCRPMSVTRVAERAAEIARAQPGRVVLASGPGTSYHARYGWAWARAVARTRAGVRGR
jgi:hypothetical protein